jgi:hypothetical protein
MEEKIKALTLTLNQQITQRIQPESTCKMFIKTMLLKMQYNDYIEILNRCKQKDLLAQSKINMGNFDEVQKKVASLKEGTGFGELALIEKLGKRNATIITE